MKAIVQRFDFHLIPVAVFSAVLVIAVPTFATDGYFSNGYGIKAKGRAGVSLTATDDAFGGANNPATTAWGANRVDFGIDYFRPDRDAERYGATGPASVLNGQVDSDSKNFVIPEFGIKYSLTDKLSLGLTIYGNGGMNTDYTGATLNFGPGGVRNLLAGYGSLGVDFSQLFIAPTVSYKITPNHTVGLAPVLGYQQFKATGLDAFSPLSQNALALTNRGYDHAVGIGVRIGYLWTLNPEISFGATYTSPVYMQRFNNYRGLFAGNGSFDTPQNFGLGLGWHALPTLRLGFDYKWINYSGIDAVGNPSRSPGLLGQSGGPGFGWQNINIYKFGVDWQVVEPVTLRLGYSYGDNPINASDVTFNILAPGVIQHHLTFGGTYATGHHELSLAYMHGFYNSVTGSSILVAQGAAPPGTIEKISMSQDSVGIQYSYKF